MMEYIIEAVSLEDMIDGYGVIGRRIVRCKDCKWWEDPEYSWDGETELPQRLCWVHDSYVEANDFCSKGERSEDENV